MSKLRKEFSGKKWAKCCGSFCSDCKIANLYRKEHGKKKGKKKFVEDHLKMNGIT